MVVIKYVFLKQVITYETAEGFGVNDAWAGAGGGGSIHCMSFSLSVGQRQFPFPLPLIS